MRYNKLGRTGLFVSELCLGTMTFGATEGRWRLMGQLDQPTADADGKGGLRRRHQFLRHRQCLCGRDTRRTTWARPCATSVLPREQLVIATKVLGPMRPSTSTGADSRESTSWTRSRRA